MLKPKTTLLRGWMGFSDGKPYSFLDVSYTKDGSEYEDVRRVTVIVEAPKPRRRRR